MERKLTVKEYADLRKITVQGVRKAIRMGHYLPGVRVKKEPEFFGKAYVLYVSEHWYRKTKNSLKINA